MLKQIQHALRSLNSQHYWNPSGTIIFTHTHWLDCQIWSSRRPSVLMFPLSWCFSIKHKGLSPCRAWALHLHFFTTRCLTEWKKPVNGITQWQKMQTLPLRQCHAAAMLSTTAAQEVLDDSWFNRESAKTKVLEVIQLQPSSIVEQTKGRGLWEGPEKSLTA